MSTQNWEEMVKEHLEFLCVETGGRSAGSQGNHKAAEYIRQVFSASGWQVHSPQFDCLKWKDEGCSLRAGDREYEARVSPYSGGGKWNAPLLCVGSPVELERESIEGKIVLLYGDLTREQWTPKKFPFYQNELHQNWIDLLEKKSPLAIIAATGRDPQMAGGVYSFPLIEDGDFDIPSVYLTEEIGKELVERAGQMVELEIRAERSAGQGCNVCAELTGKSPRRVVCFAHFNAKLGTPGALDNASGVAILLLLAKMLGGRELNWTIKLTALNGEDHYANPGEVVWLKENQSRFADIILGINFDLVGYCEGRTAFSFYQIPQDLEDLIRRHFLSFEGLVNGEAWFQSDHSLFLMNGVPALAFAAEKMTDLMQHVIHTSKDTPDIVAIDRVVETALAVSELIKAIPGY